MWLRLSCCFGPRLSWHLPSAHKTASHARCRKRRTHRFFMLLQTRSLIKFCGSIWKEGEVLKATCLSLLAGMVRRKLSCVCPLVAQSRCPNQFPQHFLLSTPHQRFKTLIVKSLKRKRISMKWHFGERDTITTAINTVVLTRNLQKKKKNHLSSIAQFWH